MTMVDQTLCLHKGVGVAVAVAVAGDGDGVVGVDKTLDQMSRSRQLLERMMLRTLRYKMWFK